MDAKTPPEPRKLTIQVMLLPKDTNAHGTIFGGVILSHIDLAGAVEARRHTAHQVVTVAMEAVVFKEPVYVGDLVSCYTRCMRIGRTSIRVLVEVEAQRSNFPRAIVSVTSAEVVYVAVDHEGRKITLGPDPPG